MRYSRQRERIYQYLIQSEEHPTAEMIYTDLRAEMPELSLGTVYRNLKLLEELGKIRRVTAISGNERYDAICGDHAHFLCQECGALRDLKQVDAEKVIQTIPLGEGYRFTKLDIMITGRCPHCAGNC
jgi:Fur family peroxide stress response transcriptional regulator